MYGKAVSSLWWKQGQAEVTSTSILRGISFLWESCCSINLKSTWLILILNDYFSYFPLFFHYNCVYNALPNDEILNLSKSKGLEGDKLNATEMKSCRCIWKCRKPCWIIRRKHSSKPGLSPFSNGLLKRVLKIRNCVVKIWQLNQKMNLLCHRNRQLLLGIWMFGEFILMTICIIPWNNFAHSYHQISEWYIWIKTTAVHGDAKAYLKVIKGGITEWSILW